MSKLSEDFLKSFGKVTTIPLSETEEKRLASVKDTIAAFMKKRGFSNKAIELVDLQVSAHTLVMPKQKGWQDAYHPCDGGARFYQICLTVTGGKISDLISSVRQKPLNNMTHLEQACYFAFACGMQAGSFRLGNEPLYFMTSEKDSFVVRLLDMLAASDDYLKRDGVTVKKTGARAKPVVKPKRG